MSRRHPELDAEARAGRTGGERPTEQLSALSHARQPVAAGVTVGGRLAEVLDAEPSARLLVGELELDALGARVLADIRERLLGRPEERQTRVGVELVAVAGDRDRRRDARVALELGHERREALGPGELLVTQRRNCATRLLDPAAGEAVRTLEGLDELGVVVGRGAQSRTLELEREPRERVREHVVHFTREALALAEHGGPRLRFASLLELAQKALGLLLAFGESPGEPRDDVEGDDAEFLQQRTEDALVLAGDLGDRQRDEGERDDHGAGGAADAQRRSGDGNECAEEGRPFRLERDERGRAENEQGERRHLRGRRPTRREQDRGDAGGEADQRKQDSEVLTRQARPGMRTRTRDLDQRQRSPAERTHRPEHPLLPCARLFERCHRGSVGTPAAPVIAGRVETDFHPGVERDLTERPMTGRRRLRTFADMSEIVISVEGLTKRYGDVEAVRGIDLEVRRGEIFAFLGPNGAGKTTTVEILEGFRTASSGTVSVLGVDPAHAGPGWRNRVGAVLQESQTEPGLTVRECLELYAGYYTNPRSIAETIALVGLEGKADTLGDHLSGGQRRRLDVALALIGDPELIFLDEPTTGFDPSARRTAWHVIDGLRELGKTVFLTTHYMDEAEELADRIAVIAGGQIVAEGTPGTLGGRNRMAATIRFTLPEGTGADELPAELRALLAGEDGRVTLTTEKPLVHVAALSEWALRRGIDLPDLDVRRPTLEDVYLELTKEPQ